MIDLPGNLIRVNVTFGPQVSLPFFRELPEIMPESGEVAPVPGGLLLGRLWGKHFRGELGGPEGDFIEMAVVGCEILAFVTVFSLALIRGGAERSE